MNLKWDIAVAVMAVGCCSDITVVHSLSASSGTSPLGARTLGTTDLVVSEACLGTMTFGVQNTPPEALEQLDYARAHGVNFLDTAEKYPIPETAEDWRSGATEEIIGTYLSCIGRSERDQLVIATKVAGYVPNSPIAAARYRHNGVPLQALDCRLDAPSVKAACEASLRRLQTDRIDLYQIHWPDRYVPVFGQTAFDLSKKRENPVPIEETVAALRGLIEDGKIRCIGICNETPMGVCHWIQACDKLGIRDKLATLQNSYSLLDRRFDGDLAEICDEYDLGLLPWSILGGGLLSGKYQSEAAAGSAAKNSRYVRFPNYMPRYNPFGAREETLNAVSEYTHIAHKAGMSPAELAIAFCRSRPFISQRGSIIIGATTLDQLKENLKPFVDGSVATELDDEILDAIDQVHAKCRDPACSI